VTPPWAMLFDLRERETAWTPANQVRFSATQAYGLGCTMLFADEHIALPQMNHVDGPCPEAAEEGANCRLAW
jgi:hypothetical protein